MHPLWKRVGERPDVKGLEAPVAAEVLLCVGILTSWIGSKEGIENAQEVAKNLISEGITFYESVGDVKTVAASRSDIAFCYFREGALDEARIMLTEALQQLTTEGNTRARALLKLTAVEWSASRYNVALEILTDNASLFEKATNHTTRGNYHNELAIVLRHLATSEKRNDYFQRAIIEYQAADHYFQLAKNKVFQANVKNNLGFLLYKLSRFKDAHKYLDEARRLAVSIKNKVQIAEIDESRAQVLIAQRKFKEAEAVMRSAVRVLEKSGHQCLLADALVTHGISLARLKHKDRAQFTFQRALEVAHQVGALHKAGLVALTMIEEVDQLSPDILRAAYDQASEWLEKPRSQELMMRLEAVARVVAGPEGKATAEQPIEILLNTSCDLQQEVLKYEGALIRQALAKVDGRLTLAAKLLRTSYQGLAYIIDARHKYLLKERTPVRRRSRKE
jgi:tetratricopeptide (TPR) repeat protein